MNEKVINAYCGCVDENGLWFVHLMLPVLFYYNFDTRKIEKWSVIPIKNELQLRARLFSAVLKIDEKLYIISGIQGKSYIYDIKTQQFEELKSISTEQHDLYSGAYLMDDYICLIPFLCDMPKKIYLRDLSVQGGEKWHKVKKETNEILQNHHEMDKDGNVFIPLYDRNAYLKYDIPNNKWSRFEINESIKAKTITINKAGLYVYDGNSCSIVNVDDSGNVLKRQHIGTECTMLYSTDDFILADEWNDDKVVLLDNNLNVIDKIYKEKITCDLNDPAKSCFWIKIGDNLCGIMRNNKIIVVNKDGVIDEMPLYISKNDWEEIKRDYIKNTLVQRECGWIGIKEFIETEVNADKM